MARPLAAFLLLTALALAGCTASDTGSEPGGSTGGGDGSGAGTGTGSSGTGGASGSGSASAFLKDAPADEFRELHVMVTAACIHRSGSGSDGATTSSATTTTTGGNATSGNGTTTGNGTGNLTTSGSGTSTTTTTTASTGTMTGDSSGRTDPCMGPSQQGQGRQGAGTTGTLGTCAARGTSTMTTTTTAATTTTGSNGTAGNGTTSGNGTSSGTETVTTSGAPVTPSTTTATAGTTTAGGWIILFSDPAGLDVDLLNTTGPRAAFLGEASLAAGSYQQIRIEVCAAWGVTHTGENVTIEVASGTLRSVRSFTIAAGEESRVTVDLDLERSLREQGNGQWRLTPVVGKTTVATVSDSSSGEDVAEPGEVVGVPEAGDGGVTTDSATTTAGTGGNATSTTGTTAGGNGTA